MIVLYCVLALAAILLGAAYMTYRMVFYSPNKTQNDDFSLPVSDQTEPLLETIKTMIREVNAIPYERVSVTSSDGLRLAGRYYHQRDGAPLAILFHGYRGTPARDFSGGTQLYRDEGFNLLMIEERAHCTSEGHTVTFGVKERQDCLKWIEYAQKRFGEDTPVLLCGISMGAATVLMASGLRLPECVKGIIADAPFTNPKEIIVKVCRDRKLPPRIVWPLLRLGARIYGGFDPTGADAAEAVKRSPVPILLIHGEDDRFVPCEMGRRIAAANPDRVELHTFPRAGHGLSFLVDRPRYEQIARTFLARVFHS
jgi:pimeloyl-ACP methyl ester carboxylesterase